MTRNVCGFFALGSILVAGSATADVLSAQQSGGTGGMKGMTNMMERCPMMGAMRESPWAVLEQREALDLDAAQVQRLVALQERTEQARKPMMARMQAVHQEIRRAAESDRFDEAAARAAFDRMGDLHTNMAVAMFRTRDEVRQILPPEQRRILRESGGGTMGMSEGMNMMEMMEMMGNCPMMPGGMMEGMNGMPMQGSGGGSKRHRPQI